MKKILAIVAILGCGAAAWAQMRPKTQEEATALQAVFSATDVDGQITAAQSALEKFADTDFKSVLLQVIAQGYQRKNDFAKSVVFGERSLEADPKNYESMLLLASQYVRNTKETDFDMQDKLKKAETYATNAATAVKDAPKPNPELPDVQWDGVKKDVMANSHEVLGQVAMMRKKPDQAVTEYKTALDTASTKDPVTYVRLAQANNALGKFDDALAAAELAMNAPNAQPAVKQYAQAERARAMQGKNKGATPAAPVPPGASAKTPAPAGSPVPVTTDTPAATPK